VRRANTIRKSGDYFTASVCHDPTHLAVALVERYVAAGSRPSDAESTVVRGMGFSALAHPWRRISAGRLRRVEPSALDPLPEVADGGAALRAYMETRGHNLEVVEASPSTCTIRMAIGPLGSRPAPLTVTAEAVEAAGWDSHPVWRADPQRFLEAAVTRAAAKKVLADEALVADETRPMLWTSGRRRRRGRVRRRAA
jgi:hypothetical protein